MTLFVLAMEKIARWRGKRSLHEGKGIFSSLVRVLRFTKSFVKMNERSVALLLSIYCYVLFARRPVFFSFSGVCGLMKSDTRYLHTQCSVGRKILI